MANVTNIDAPARPTCRAQGGAVRRQTRWPGTSPAIPNHFPCDFSMQPEFPVDCLELGRLDELAMRDAHRMQWPFKLFHPERQETLQLGKFGKEIVVLPDVGLQKPAMIGTPIQNVRGRKAITTDLLTEIL